MRTSSKSIFTRVVIKVPKETRISAEWPSGEKYRLVEYFEENLNGDDDEIS